MVGNGLPPFHAPGAPIPVDRTLPEFGRARGGAGTSMPFNNGSEQALRPCAIFRKVTNCFRSAWGADLYAGVRSVIETARRRGIRILHAIRLTLEGTPLPLAA